MKKSKISIKDIAELSGVSVATVSRVINQNGRFSKETEQRVKNIIDQYHYHPNELARGLRVDKAQVVGVIIPDITSEFFSYIAREIEGVLLRNGYVAVLCDTNEKLELEQKYIEMLKSMRVGGIIYVSGDQHVKPIENIPAVYVDRKPEFIENREGYCFIGSDNYRGGYLAAKRLLEAGRRKLVLVLHNKTLATQERRLNGYRQALAEYNVAFEEQRVIKVSAIDMETGYAVTRQILEQNMEVDGIFYSSDILAIGALQYFHEKQIKIPERISVIGFDDIPLSGKVTPALTTIRQQYLEFGRMAAESVVKMMKGDKEYHKYIMDVSLIERETV